ncbi:hypothetical protein GCM10020218_042590 [Dactylosporangium vinaceum]
MGIRRFSGAGGAATSKTIRLLSTEDSSGASLAEYTRPRTSYVPGAAPSGTWTASRNEAEPLAATCRCGWSTVNQAGSAPSPGTTWNTARSARAAGLVTVKVVSPRLASSSATRSAAVVTTQLVDIT